MTARRRRDNIVVVVLAVLAVLGGGHAVLSWFRSPPAGPSDSATVSLIGHSALAASFAEDFVVTYLSSTAGQQDRLSSYLDSGQQLRLPATAHPVSDPLVVHVGRTESSAALEIWEVTVSVVPGRNSAASERQYYQVAVSVTPDGRRRALSVPAMVEPPGIGPDVTLAYSTPCSTETPLADVARGFLTAYLTGSGDVARYTTTQSGITVLRPAPMRGLEVVGVSSDDSTCGSGRDSARVLATVAPKNAAAAAPSDSSGSPQSSQHDSGLGTAPGASKAAGPADGAALAYPLTMVRTNGQWQVQAIDRVPALTDPLTIVTNSGAGNRSSSDAPTTTPTTTVQIPPATQN